MASLKLNFLRLFRLILNKTTVWILKKNNEMKIFLKNQNRKILLFTKYFPINNFFVDIKSRQWVKGTKSHKRLWWEQKRRAKKKKIKIPLVLRKNKYRVSLYVYLKREKKKFLNLQPPPLMASDKFGNIYFFPAFFLYSSIFLFFFFYW